MTMNNSKKNLIQNQIFSIKSNEKNSKMNSTPSTGDNNDDQENLFEKFLMFQNLIKNNPEMLNQIKSSENKESTVKINNIK